MNYLLFAEISVSFNSLYFIPLIIAIIIIVIFYYRTTIPPLNKVVRYLLIILRAITIILIILLLFEPTVFIKQTESVLPKALIIIDNSQSMTKYSNKLKNRVKFLGNKLKNKNADVSFLSFGSKVHFLKSIDSIDFNERETNFDLLFDTLLTAQNYEAAFLLSDGNITRGETPANKAERLPYPLITIGIGNKLKIRDVAISKILHNSFSFVNKPTSIKTEIINKGFGDKKALVTLNDKGKVISSRKITLAKSGFNIVDFTYTPKSKGEKRLTIKVSKLSGDINPSNNASSFFIKAFPGKIKVLLITGSPNYDFEFISRSLEHNKDFLVKKYYQLLKNDNNYKTLQADINNSNVIGLISFPSVNKNLLLQKLVISAISSKPYFIVLSNNVSFSELLKLKNDLDFNVRNSQFNILNGQVVIHSLNNPIFDIPGFNLLDASSDLPPISAYSNIAIKSYSTILASVKPPDTHLEIPFIISSSHLNLRSLSILGGDLWRWKLNPNISAQYFFDSFWRNTIKWLNAANIKNRIKVFPAKKIFNKNESIFFNAEVFDEKLFPIDNANIEVKVKNKSGNYSIILLNKGSGLYEGKFANLIPGEYYFTAKVKLNGNLISTKKGKFFVRNINIEKIIKNIDVGSLKLLAAVSGGKYLDADNFNDLSDVIDNLFDGKTKLIKKEKEIHLTGNPYYLYILILFFSLELLIRKRKGLI